MSEGHGNTARLSASRLAAGTRAARADGSGAPRWRSWLKHGIALLILALAVWFLAREVQRVGPAEVLTALRSLPASAIAGALGLTAVSYLVLSCFDYMAIRHFQIALRYRIALITAFIVYAFNFSLGSIVGAVGLRYRLYGKWGLAVGDITRVTVYAAATAWVGYCIFAGVVLSITALPVPGRFGVPIETFRPLGLVALALGVLYFVLCAVHARPIRIRRWTYELPEPQDACLQVGISCCQWFLISAVLFLTFPKGTGVTFFDVLAIHLVAAVAGLVLHVPGGIGVLEGTFLVMLGDRVPKQAILGSLLAFRIIYYALPLAMATVALLVIETRKPRQP